MSFSFLVLSEGGLVQSEGISDQENYFTNDFTPFMALQKLKSHRPIKFVEVFPAAKTAKPEKFIFFMSTDGPHGWASNFHVEKNGYCSNGLQFLTSEHHLMFLKAEVFKDTKIMARILEAGTPREAKKLGRQVSPYDEQTWSVFRYRSLYKALECKFLASPRLAQLLLKTGDKFLVEAADFDSKFGIGLSEFSSEIHRGCKIRATGEFDVAPQDWLGENLLGIALMELRSNLKRIFAV